MRTLTVSLVILGLALSTQAHAALSKVAPPNERGKISKADALTHYRSVVAQETALRERENPRDSDTADTEQANPGQAPKHRYLKIAGKIVLIVGGAATATALIVHGVGIDHSIALNFLKDHGYDAPYSAGALQLANEAARA